MGMRALDILAAVDVVAAEDTRHSQRLLDAHGIRTKMVAVHEHNEQAAADSVLRILDDGRHVALISDAGTPGISDPGARIVARVRAAGHPVVPVPGPCAAIAALSVSGFVQTGFHFAGFLPPRSASRRAALEGLAAQTVPLVFYESPHRIRSSVEDMAVVLGDQREIVIARELTKVFEQIVRLPLADASAWLAEDANRARGEFVLVVSPPPPREGLSAESEKVLKLLLEEIPLKSAVKLATRITGESKNLLYARALELNG